MKKFSLLGLVLIIGLFASCTPTVGHICTVFDENIVTEATCTNNGSKKCSRCTETITTDKVPHTKGTFGPGVFEKSCSCNTCNTYDSESELSEKDQYLLIIVGCKCKDCKYTNTLYYKCSKCNTDTNESWFVPYQEGSSIHNAYRTYKNMMTRSEKIQKKIENSSKIYYEDNSDYSNLYDEDKKLIK